ncbi:MAG: AAA family ATPase [Burkholderiaceae bacterium]|nr:AAA family ATPase [Burkholderiaceae bacterium]
MTTPGSAATRTDATTASPRLLLRAAGQLRLRDDAPIDLEPKDALLLAYLAVEGPTPRGRLAALLWPEVDEERARGNLRQRLLRLKRTVGVELVTGNPLAQLAAGIEHDLADDCDVLSSLDPHQVGGMAEWLQTQRDTRRRARIDWLDAAVALAETEGDLAAALEHANALVALDPLSEHAHRRVMKLHYLRGDTSAAIAAYERCRDTLRRELDTAPSKETEALRGSIAQAMVPATSALRPVPLTVLRPPRLVGRDAEWEALQSAWEQGQPAVVLGEAGMGKTRLVTDLVRVRQPALLVGARPGDERVVYAVIARLLRQLARERVAALEKGIRKELARLLPELGEAEPIRSDAERARFYNAVAAALAAQRETLHGVIVDDLHYADDASVELIQYLLGAVELRWVFAARPAELGAAARSLLERVRERATTIELTPLTEAAIAELVESLALPGIEAARVAPQLLRQTGGNPLFLLETLKSWLTQGAATEARLPAPSSVGALIERRIGRLSPEAIRLARCAAIAGQDFSVELAAHVLGVKPLDLADAWTELEAAQVFRDGAFAHDLIYESALASVPPPIARQLHRELAQILSDRGGAPARVAAHRLAAGEDLLAIDALQEAARLCIDAGRIIEGGRHLRQAAEIAAANGVDASRIFGLYYEAANAFWLTATTAEFNALIEPMRRWARTDSELARYWLAAGHRAEREGDFDAYASAIERALASAMRAGDPLLEGISRMALGSALALRGQHEKALHQVAAAADVFREIGAREEEAASRTNLGALLSRLGRFDEANRQLELAVPALVEEKNYAYLIAGYNTRAANALAAGDARRALELAEQCRVLAAAGESEAGPRAVTRQRQVEALRRLGRFREAIDVYTQARAEFDDEASFDCYGLGLEAVPLFLDLGRTDRALALMAEFERRAGVGPEDAELARLLRLRIATGHAAQAALALQIDMAQVRAPARRCAFALELARVGDRQRAPALLAEMLEQAQALGLNAYLAALWLARADLQLRDGDTAGAQAACAAAAEALASFDVDGYRPQVLLRLFRLEQQLGREESAARALNNGAPNIERADKLVQLIAKQKGLSLPAIDAQVALVDQRLDANRKKAA